MGRSEGATLMGFSNGFRRSGQAFLLLICLQCFPLVATPTPSVIPFEQPVSLIILDAGHGGQDPGAISNWSFAPNGRLIEKDLALELTLMVKDRLSNLEPSLEILLTRDADRFMALDERAAFARRMDPGLRNSAILVSIHANSATSADASGFEILMKQLTKRVLFLDAESENWQIVRYSSISNTMLNQALNRSNLLLGQSMQAALGAAFPQSRNRGVKEQDVWVLNASGVTSILVEVGFISNAQDAKDMVSLAWKHSMAEAIVRGILEYVRLSR